MTSEDPQPGEFWVTPKGRMVEIVARGEVFDSIDRGGDRSVDAFAYEFLGGSMIHLRSVGSMEGWEKVQFE